MLEDDVSQYFEQLMTILVPYLDHQTVGVREMALECLSTVIVAAEDKIQQYFTDLMPLLQKVQETPGNQHNHLRSLALECIGNVASGVGKETFEPYLEHYTNLSLETIQMGTRTTELGEAAFSFLCSICKIMRADMESFIGIVVKACCDVIKCQKGLRKANGNSELSFGESGSKQEEVYHATLDSFDEKSSAIHCVGFLVKYNAEIMKPYFKDVMDALEVAQAWLNPNIMI